MNRQSKILWIGSTVLISLGCFIIPASIRMLDTSFQYCREVSAWGALDTSIMLELGDYYKNNGRYPDSLEGLNIEFSDGATSDMLSRLQYESHGTSCTYSYYRHAGERDKKLKTRVVITFTEGKLPRETTTNERIAD
jgi:hypothetical protein